MQAVSMMSACSQHVMVWCQDVAEAGLMLTPIIDGVAASAPVLQVHAGPHLVG